MRAALWCAALTVLPGCVPAVLVGAGTVTGVAISQERTTRDALTDNEIGLSINNQLLNESGELFRRVGVDVKEGRVLLTGGVRQPQESVRATEIAWATPGVKAVTNEIVVDQQPSAQRYAEDVWITSQVRARFLADPQIASVNYSVETHDGVVHLTGIARSDAELARATRQAAAVPGVRQVVSHVLSINDPRRRPPAAPGTATAPGPVAAAPAPQAFRRPLPPDPAQQETSPA
jgi:osmotically-inducible protein OsmY